MLTFKTELLGIKVYVSDILDENRLFCFSKHCQYCGEEVNIHNNTGICWMSYDRAHHPSFSIMENVSNEK